MEEYVMESVVRGHHVYKSVWHPVLGEQLTLERENSSRVAKFLKLEIGTFDYAH